MMFCQLSFIIGVKASEKELGFTLTEVNGMGENPIASEAILRDADNPTGFNQPEKTKQLALAQYRRRVDVICPPSAESAQGVLEAAKEQQRFIIWIDSNGNHLAPGVVLTSMAKEISSVVGQIIRETIGNFMVGIRYFGLKEEGVSYTVDEHNRSLLSENMIATVESFKAKIIVGEIVVPNTVSLPRE